jgi:ribosomal protein L7Ae-like RNA K-turn-binding protein
VPLQAGGSHQVSGSPRARAQQQQQGHGHGWPQPGANHTQQWLQQVSEQDSEDYEDYEDQDVLAGWARSAGVPAFGAPMQYGGGMMQQQYGGGMMQQQYGGGMLQQQYSGGMLMPQLQTFPGAALAPSQPVYYQPMAPPPPGVRVLHRADLRQQLQQQQQQQQHEPALYELQGAPRGGQRHAAGPAPPGPYMMQPQHMGHPQQQQQHMQHVYPPGLFPGYGPAPLMQAYPGGQMAPPPHPAAPYRPRRAPAHQYLQQQHAGLAAPAAPAAAAGGSRDFQCGLCSVTCNSATTLQQHFASRRHLQNAAHSAVSPVLALAEQLHQLPRPGHQPASTYVGPNADVRSYCTQVRAPPSPPRLPAPHQPIAHPARTCCSAPPLKDGFAARASSVHTRLPCATQEPSAPCLLASTAAHPRPLLIHPQVITNEVNQAVAELLLRMKALQDRAIARNPIKGSSHRWYVCGLREVRKHIKLGKARMVVLAPNIEEVGLGWAGPWLGWAAAARVFPHGPDFGPGALQRSPRCLQPARPPSCPGGCLVRAQRSTAALRPGIARLQVESAGGLDDHVAAIVSSSAEGKVPVVFALSRKKLGDVYGTRKRMSAIAVLELNGVRELVEQVTALADEGHAMWGQQQAQCTGSVSEAAVGAGGEGGQGGGPERD